jgi:hypothetical protein
MEQNPRNYRIPTGFFCRPQIPLSTQTSGISPRRTRRMEKGVAKMLKDFPPGSGKH